MTADITKCRDNECPIKEKCLRWTTPSGVRQSYFIDSPRQVGYCPMFWGDNQSKIYEKLEEIMR